jgi:hypothetical protein
MYPPPLMLPLPSTTSCMAMLRGAATLLPPSRLAAIPAVGAEAVPSPSSDDGKAKRLPRRLDDTPPPLALLLLMLLVWQRRFMSTEFEGA